MDRLALKQQVCDVRDRFVGNVAAVNQCCFLARSNSRQWFLTPEAIFNVSKDVVTLVCEANQVERYECGIHSD